MGHILPPSLSQKLSQISYNIYDICLQSKPDKKSVKNSAKERSNGHGRFILVCSLVYKDTPKLFLGLYLIHKRRNVKFKIYLELSYFFATQPTLTGHHGRHRPYIHIRSTPVGQQLPNLKSQKVTTLYLPYKKYHIEKIEGGSQNNQCFYFYIFCGSYAILRKPPI